MRTCTFALVAAIAATLAVQPVTAEAEPRAREIALRSISAMGGQEAWDAVRLVQFDWAVERDGEVVVLYHHSWDRWTGDYLLTTRTEEGEDLAVRFNVQSREGEVRIDGSLAEGEAAADQLEKAYGRFINDSYWILMPWKWLDPGVRLTFEGERELDGKIFDVVRLEFESEIGLTSNDRYYAWVSRESGLMERWQYVLQDEEGARGEGEPTTWEWTDWQQTDSGLKLSTVKRRVGGEGDVRITFPRVDFRSDVSASELVAIFANSGAGD